MKVKNFNSIKDKKNLFILLYIVFECLTIRQCFDQETQKCKKILLNLPEEKLKKNIKIYVNITEKYCFRHLRWSP